MSPENLILASSSPRRQQLLAEAGYAFRVVPPPGTEDAIGQGESPRNYVVRLARQKAAEVAAGISSGIVLGCDTVAVCEGQILGKPADRDDARRMLVVLRGREHEVHSGLCLWSRPDDRQIVGVDTTRLVMDDFSDAQLDAYLDSGQWAGKAGAFGYQDGLDWVHIVAGSESNVVGLPLELLASLLSSFSQH